MAKLHHHRTDGTYYTKRFENGIVTRQIHPDGVAFLKLRGVAIGSDIPPFAMSELVSREWLYTKEETAGRGEVNWSPDWNAIEIPPANLQGWMQDHAESYQGRIGDWTSSAISAREDGPRLPIWGIAAAVLLMLLAAVLGMSLNG